MKKNRLIAALLAFMMLFLVSCGKKEAPPSAEPETVSETAAPEETPAVEETPEPEEIFEEEEEEEPPEEFEIVLKENEEIAFG